MRILLFVMMIFSVSQNYSQLASFHTYADTSNNGSFVVELSGGMYEGYAGNQTIKLIDANHQILWEREFNRRGLVIPYVSDSGIVAVPEKWRNLSFYKTDGNLLTQFQLDKNQEFIYFEDPTDIKNYKVYPMSWTDFKDNLMCY